MDHNSSLPLHPRGILTASMSSLVKSLRVNQSVRLPYSSKYPTLFNINLFSSCIVRQIENFPTSSGDAPTSPIVIADCGVLSPDDPSLAPASVADGDAFEDYPEDEDRDVQKPEVALDIAKTIREVGNKLFKEGKIAEALDKYQSKRLLVGFFPQ